MKDWLGQEYGEGDLIIYAASTGAHGHDMVVAEVVKFNDTTVTVQPLRSSRHGERQGYAYFDERSGKNIDPYSNKSWHNPDVWSVPGSGGSMNPAIKRVRTPARPVALKVTKNITKWHGTAI